MINHSWWSYDYMKIIYVNYGVKPYMKEDHNSYKHNFCSCKKKAWKKFRLVWDSGFFLQLEKLCSITAMIILHLNLHSTVHIHYIWFSYVQNGNIIVKNDITYNRSKVNSKFCNLFAIVNLWSGELQVKHWEKKHAD